MMASLSHNTILCISHTILLRSLLSCTNWHKSSSSCPTPPPQASYNAGMNCTLYELLLSLNSKNSYWHFIIFSNHLFTLLFLLGHAISTIYISFFSLSLRVRSGRLAMQVILILYSQSHSSLFPPCSKIFTFPISPYTILILSMMRR